MRQILITVLALAALGLNAAEYPAELDWSRRATLSSMVSGVVERIWVAPGERVAQGQRLVQFDLRPFQLAVERDQAQVRKFKLIRDEAQREFERTQELYERTVISEHDLQLGEIAYATAQADAVSAQSLLDQAQLDLTYAQVQAPFAGRVLAIPVQVGEVVISTEQARPLIILAADHPMTARAALSAQDFGALELGAPVTVVVGNARYPATITGLVEADGRYLEAGFDPGTANLHAAQPARIVMP